MLEKILLLDDILNAQAVSLGGDFAAYRNHAYRVANICAAFAPDADTDKLAIAAGFHDIGIWTAGTFDYLPPSRQLAGAYLEKNGRGEWSAEIDTAIMQHHKLTAYRGDADGLAEPFRKADLVDVSLGLVRFGLSRGFMKELYASWPDEGFHGKLVHLALGRLRSHPFSPLPMLKL